MESGHVHNFGATFRFGARKSANIEHSRTAPKDSHAASQSLDNRIDPGRDYGHAGALG
jgi:hypothetical protein